MPLEEDFYHRIYDIVRLIPSGKVTTYGHIARALGTGRSARVVGWAMNMSHKSDPEIPAHRVVNRNGFLSGRMHFKSPDQMQELLEKEGVNICENQVVDFKTKLWDPAELASSL